MNLFEKARIKLGVTPTDRLIRSESELMLHEFVARRLDSGVFEKGVWAMALKQAEGDDDRAKGIYIDLAVKRLKREISAGVGISPDYERFQEAYRGEVRQQQGLARQIEKTERQIQRLHLENESRRSSQRLWGVVAAGGFGFMLFTGGATVLVALPAAYLWAMQGVKLSRGYREEAEERESLVGMLEKQLEQSQE